MPGISRPVPRDEFRQVCSQFATGVTVVTTADSSGEPHGFTANSFVSVSAEPPLVMVCIDLGCSLLDCFNRATDFCINVLAEDQERISSRFAQSCDPRFDGVAWQPGIAGAPQITGAIASLSCRVVDRIPAGDHIMMLGEVLETQLTGGRPLLFFASRYRHLTMPEG